MKYYWIALYLTLALASPLFAQEVLKGAPDAHGRIGFKETRSCRSGDCINGKGDYLFEYRWQRERLDTIEGVRDKVRIRSQYESKLAIPGKYRNGKPDPSFTAFHIKATTRKYDFAYFNEHKQRSLFSGDPWQPVHQNDDSTTGEFFDAVPNENFKIKSGREETKEYTYTGTYKEDGNYLEGTFYKDEPREEIAMHFVMKRNTPKRIRSFSIPNRRCPPPTIASPPSF